MAIGYLGRRFGMLVAVFIVAATANFMIPRLIPGDPVENKLNQMIASGGQVGDVLAMAQEYRSKFGLEQPLWRQYISYWQDLLTLDLGYSLDKFPQRVSHMIMAGLPWTIGLLMTSTLISFSIGILLGALLAWPAVPVQFRALVPMLMVFSAIPYFLLGIVLIFLFVITIKVFPAGGGYPYGSILKMDLPSIVNVLRHATLPALSIVISGMGFWALGMRGMMISILGEDFITLAEAKGLKPIRVFLRYGMRNAMLPSVTSLALVLGHVVSGSVLVEVIFSYPGLGLKLYQAIGAKDYFVIQGIIWLLIVTIAAALFVLDIIYPLIDPRIAYKRR